MDRRGVKSYTKNDEVLKNRQEVSIQLRNKKKFDEISKKRGNFNPSSINIINNDNNISEPIVQIATLKDDLVKYEQSNQTNELFETLRKIRRLLSVNQNPPALECIKLGIIQYCIRYLSLTNFPGIQFESSWILTNVASTELTYTLLDGVKAQTSNGQFYALRDPKLNAIKDFQVVQVDPSLDSVPPLIALLSSNNKDLVEQAAWCLGNIAGDNVHFRDYIINGGGLDIFVSILNSYLSTMESINEHKSMIGNITWALSNLCRGKPKAKLDLVRPAIDPFFRIIMLHFDASTSVDATWAISYISDGENNRITAIANMEVLSKILSNIKDCIEAVFNNPECQTPLLVPSLRILGNIASGTAEQTQYIVDLGIIEYLAMLLKHPKDSVKKEVCWVLSNIAAGNDSQHSEMTKFNIIPSVMEIIMTATKQPVLIEAIWVMANFIVGCKNFQILFHLCQLDVINSILSKVEVCQSVHSIVLDALSYIFEKYCENNINPADLISNHLNDASLNLIENFQTSKSKEVAGKALALIDKFFDTEDDK